MDQDQEEIVTEGEAEEEMTKEILDIDNEGNDNECNKEIVQRMKSFLSIISIVWPFVSFIGVFAALVSIPLSVALVFCD